MEGEKNPLVYEDLYKSWEYVDEDGSVVRLTEEDKNDLVAQSPADAQYIRRRVYTPDEKRMLNQVAQGKVLEGDEDAAARALYPKAMREWELHDERGDDSLKALARQAYAGVGDIGNLPWRALYKAATGEPMSEDYGAEGLDESAKSAAWHLSRDKWALPLLLATRGKSLGSTATTGAVTGGALAAVPTAVDALAREYLGVETIPQATKENPLQAIGASAGFGAAAGTVLGKLGGVLGRAGAQKVGEVLSSLSPKAREVVEKGLAEVARTAAKTERPVSVARQFDAAATAIEKAAATEAQKAEAKAALASVRKVVEDEIFSGGGKMRSPSKIAEAVENVVGDVGAVEGKGAAATAEKAAMQRAKKAVEEQLGKAPLNRVNSSLEKHGVSLSQSELDEILALKPGDVPANPATRNIVERLATRLGKSGWDAVAAIQSLASSAPRVASEMQGAPKPVPKGLREEGKKGEGE